MVSQRLILDNVPGMKLGIYLCRFCYYLVISIVIKYSSFSDNRLERVLVHAIHLVSHTYTLAQGNIQLQLGSQLGVHLKLLYLLARREFHERHKFSS